MKGVEPDKKKDTAPAPQATELKPIGQLTIDLYANFGWKLTCSDPRIGHHEQLAIMLGITLQLAKNTQPNRKQMHKQLLRMYNEANFKS
jgi:hypothetical protein